MSKQSYIEYLYEQKMKKGGVTTEILEVDLKYLNKFLLDYEDTFKKGSFLKNQNNLNKTHQLLIKLSEHKNMDSKIRNIIMKCISLYESAFTIDYYNNKKEDVIKKISINSDKNNSKNKKVNLNNKSFSKKPNVVNPKLRKELKGSLPKNNKRTDRRDLKNLQDYTNSMDFKINWENVKDDGNSFFRAVALGLFGDEDKYQSIRDFIANKIEKDMNDEDFNTYKIDILKQYTDKENYKDKMKKYDNTINSFGGQFEFKYFIKRYLTYYFKEYNFKCYEFIFKDKYICISDCNKNNLSKNNILIIGHIGGSKWAGTKSKYKNFSEDLKNNLNILFKVS